MNKSILVFGILFLVVLTACIAVGKDYTPAAVTETRAESTYSSENSNNNTAPDKGKTKPKTTSNQSKAPASGSAQSKDFASLFTAVNDSEAHNNELQNYIASQVNMSGNTVKLTANKTKSGYVSGKAESKTAFRYGTFSFRINNVKGMGLFPAVWLKPLNSENGYPEVDIYEAIGRAPNEINGVLHYIENGKKLNKNFQYKIPEKDVSNTYIIKFKWTPGKMVWYLNDKPLYTVTEHIPDEPMYMVINLAVGGNWPGNPDASTKFPASFNVEVLEFEPYEVYQK